MRDIERVTAGHRVDADVNRGLPVVPAARVVIFSAEFRARDIGHAHEVAVLDPDYEVLKVLYPGYVGRRTQINCDVHAFCLARA